MKMLLQCERSSDTMGSRFLQVFTTVFMSCRLLLRPRLAGCRPRLICAASCSSMICWAAWRGHRVRRQTLEYRKTKRAHGQTWAIRAGALLGWLQVQVYLHSLLQLNDDTHRSLLRSYLGEDTDDDDDDDFKHTENLACVHT